MRRGLCKMCRQHVIAAYVPVLSLRSPFMLNISPSRSLFSFSLLLDFVGVAGYMGQFWPVTKHAVGRALAVVNMGLNSWPRLLLSTY